MPAQLRSVPRCASHLSHFKRACGRSPFAATLPPCILSSAPQIVRYYEAVARWPLAASPSKSRGLGLLLRSHLTNGCAAGARFGYSTCWRMHVHVHSKPACLPSARLLLMLPSPSLCPSTRRRFSASEGSRLLTAWAYLRRRQPFNPGAGGGRLAVICC